MLNFKEEFIKRRNEIYNMVNEKEATEKVKRVHDSDLFILEKTSMGKDRYICVACGEEIAVVEHTEYTVWKCLHCGRTIKLSKTTDECTTNGAREV